MNASSILLLWPSLSQDSLRPFLSHFTFMFFPTDRGEKVLDASEHSTLVQLNHLIGASFANTVANFFTSDSVFASRNDFELYHSSAPYVMKVLSPLSAMGTMPEAAERVGLTSAETSLTGQNISLSSGFL
jgi:hypothetical protein